jgi:hypothetical protein
MTDHDEQLARLRDAVDRKSAAAEEASHHPGATPAPGDDVKLDRSGHMQPGIQTGDRSSQDVLSPRDKNSGHGKKTADKWNQ